MVLIALHKYAKDKESFGNRNTAESPPSPRFLYRSTPAEELQHWCSESGNNPLSHSIPNFHHEIPTIFLRTKFFLREALKSNVSSTNLAKFLKFNGKYLNCRSICNYHNTNERFSIWHWKFHANSWNSVVLPGKCCYNDDGFYLSSNFNFVSSKILIPFSLNCYVLWWMHSYIVKRIFLSYN